MTDETTPAAATQPKFLNSLEDLLTEAMIHRTPPRTKKPVTHLRADLKAIEARLKEVFTNPENWERTHGVCLLHKETQALLGNFSEYRHKTVANCRKLVRESEPMAIDCNEWVSGPQWIEQSPGIESPARWAKAIEACIDIHLHELGLWGQAVRVMAHTFLDNIERVELCVSTRFHSKDSHVVMHLPAGLNILSGMSLDSKLALREEVLVEEQPEQPE